MKRVGVEPKRTMDQNENLLIQENGRQGNSERKKNETRMTEIELFRGETRGVGEDSPMAVGEIMEQIDREDREWVRDNFDVTPESEEWEYDHEMDWEEDCESACDCERGWIRNPNWECFECPEECNCADESDQEWEEDGSQFEQEISLSEEWVDDLEWEEEWGGDDSSMATQSTWDTGPGNSPASSSSSN